MGIGLVVYDSGFNGFRLEGNGFQWVIGYRLGLRNNKEIIITTTIKH